MGGLLGAVLVCGCMFICKSVYNYASNRRSSRRLNSVRLADRTSNSTRSEHTSTVYPNDPPVYQILDHEHYKNMQNETLPPSLDEKDLPSYEQVTLNIKERSATFQRQPE